MERLAEIGITEIPSTVPKLRLKGKEVRIRRREYQKHYYDVKVTTFDHLKLLVGNPDRSLETNDGRELVPYLMDAREVPDGKLDDFRKLSVFEQVAVHKAAKNIVYGHSRALAFSEYQLANLTEWILKQLGHPLPVFQCPDLDVANGTIVTFSDAAVLNFGIVTVHGSGSIKLESAAKIFANDMRVVP